MPNPHQAGKQPEQNTTVSASKTLGDVRSRLSPREGPNRIIGGNFSNHPYDPPDDSDILLSLVKNHRDRQCGLVAIANVV